MSEKVEKQKQKKKFKMPSAYVIVYIALIITIALTHFIPVSVVDENTGEVVYSATFGENGEIINDAGTRPMGFWDLLTAPIKGFHNASDVGIALLVAGGFLSVLAATGGLEAGIGKLLKKLDGKMLIALMMLVFALMGTVFGFWEEITPFSLVVVPMFVAAGYDVMTGLGVLFIGATVGNMASVVNPFAAGAAVAAVNNPELTLGSGLVLRAITFIVLYVIATIMMIKYGSAVKADKTKSVLYGEENIKESAGGEELPEMNRKRFWSMMTFIIMVILMLIGYIPWKEIGGDGVYNAINMPFTLLEGVPYFGDIIGAQYFTRFGDWGFTEFTALFLLGSFVLLIINKMKSEDFIKHFFSGAQDLLGVVFVLAISRGIAIVMGSSTSGMSVTFIYWISNAISGIPLWIFAVIAILAYLLIGIFLQSTSGVAGISMPILGAVAAALFAASAIGSQGGQIVLISSFALGLNFTNLLYPGATNLGTNEMFGVSYAKHLKFSLKFAIPLLLVGAIIISIAPSIGIVF